MERFYRLCLIISGIVNALPALAAFLSTERISVSYGVDLQNGNLELLLRHRAIFFGMLGLFMILSGIRKRYYQLSTMAGLISMGSFILLYFLIGEISQELTRIMIVDMGAASLLLVSFLLFRFSDRH